MCRGWFALLLLVLLVADAGGADVAEAAATATAAAVAVAAAAAAAAVLGAAWPGRGGADPELDLVLDAVIGHARKLSRAGLCRTKEYYYMRTDKYSTEGSSE